MNKEKEFFTAKELAEKLRVNIMTIYRYIGAKKLKAYKIGKDFRIEKKDFDNLMKKASSK
jgi:excisionase family DNA binding protein